MKYVCVNFVLQSISASPMSETAALVPPPAKRIKPTRFTPCVWVVIRRRLCTDSTQSGHSVVEGDGTTVMRVFFDEALAYQHAFELNKTFWEPEFATLSPSLQAHWNREPGPFEHLLLDDLDCKLIRDAPYRSRTRLERFIPADELLCYHRPTFLYRLMYIILSDLPPELLYIILEYNGQDLDSLDERLVFMRSFLRNEDIQLGDGAQLADPPGVSGKKWAVQWAEVHYQALEDAIVDETLFGVNSPSITIQTNKREA
jgi:hypothetical protein